MNQDHLDMESVTLELGEEELEEIDDIAFADHRDNREAAIRELLDRWLKQRGSDESE
ncbi:ribbon-helix-helix protein, CopG family [Halorussus caseinilyticus]|uniref:Ribbon-helix-helix protein, CopG family n=1 Tax=Halorussus caseinilyticus TaxID=3034025 RepID=A0ABD5WMT0_9EURY|nr:ribbon-helix-helix protein, CopG family [Halorussus sp. DT72]